MTTQEKNQMLLSAFVGFIVTLIYAVFFGHQYAQGGIEWLQWSIDHIVPFIFSAALCYAALFLYQLLGNNIWDIKKSFKKLSKDILCD